MIELPEQNDIYKKLIDKREKRMKFCLLGATFTTSNMGVSALTSGIIKCILNSYPNAEIILLDYWKEPIEYKYKYNNRMISIKLINMRFSKKLYLKNHILFLIMFSLILRFILFKSLKEKIISKNFCMRHLNESDIVASIAGGDSFSDIYGLKRLFYVSFPQILAILLKKKFILLPQTIGPFEKKISQLIARYIMNRADTIYSRDYHGLEITDEMIRCTAKKNKIKFCYDVGFVIDPKRPPKFDLGNFSFEKKTIIGLNVSGLLFIGGYNYNNMFGLKINYADLISQIITVFMQKRDTVIMLIPHVYGSNKQSESDVPACEKIYTQVASKYPNRMFLIKGDYDQNEIKYIIGLCDFFIGSRMHSCIAAISQEIPTVGIAYSRKFKGVFHSIDLESLVADPREMSEYDIIETIESAYENRNKIRKYLHDIMPKVNSTILDIFKVLTT